MATLDMRMQLDSREAEALVRAIEARGNRPPMRRVAVVGMASIARDFAVGGRPKKWAPFAPSTKRRNRTTRQSKRAKAKLARKGGGQHRLLRDTGTMQGTIKPEFLGRSNLAIGTDYAIAPFHQFGTKTIPARVFVLWQVEDVELIEQILADFLMKGR